MVPPSNEIPNLDIWIKIIRCYRLCWTIRISRDLSVEDTGHGGGEGVGALACGREFKGNQQR